MQAHQQQIHATLTELYSKAKLDAVTVMKGVAKSFFRPIKPIDFKEAFLCISKEQGEDLTKLIKAKNIRNVVEFGTSFGISTLFLALGVMKTKGKIVTTELIESKGKKAIENFKKSGVEHLIDVRIGDALNTLKNYNEPIDLLLLDGWKDLYLSVFKLLESNFHSKTIIYVDNADMRESIDFLKTVSQDPGYKFQYKYDGKVVLISKYDRI